MMQFAFDDDLNAARELADEVFDSLAAVERVRTVENELGGFDPHLWAALAETGLLGLAVPERDGGSGLGVLGLVALLERHGRSVAPVPLAASLATAVLPLAEHGSDAQRARWLPGALDGSLLLTGGVDTAIDGDRALRAVRDGDGWVVDGTLAAVPAGSVATAALVPLTTASGTIAAIVPLDRDGIGREPVAVTNRSATAALTFTAVRVADDELVGAGDAAIVRARTLGRVAAAAVQTGVCAEAIQRTAAYTSERVQFDRPLSTNQAVTQRLADAHLDVERIALTTRRAAWLLDAGDAGDPAADAAVLVAAWWAAHGGLRAVHATQHLHGGLGADIEYPIHRYFLWGRQIAFSLGTAPALAAELGAIIETVPPIGAPQ